MSTHLLGSIGSISSQARCYSSESRDPSDGNDSQNPTGHRPNLATNFGFQNLSVLFPQPVRGRYSRPPPEIEENSPSLALKQGHGQSNKPELAPRARNGFFGFGSSQQADLAAPRDRERQQFEVRPDRLEQPPASVALPDSSRTENVIKPPGTQMSSFASTSATNNSHLTGILKPFTSSQGDRKSSQSTLPSRQHRHLTRKHIVASNPAVNTHTRLKAEAKREYTNTQSKSHDKRPSPFGSDSAVVFKHLSPTRNPKATEAWGLRNKDMQTMDSIADHSAASAPKNELTSDPKLRAGADEIGTASTTPDKALTHIRPTGEAHMVDVGAKTASRRVAIAHAWVRFSNAETYKLVVENNNKKGDVLGVARIAGIMAAKRTSDLIPLCHPISISKVEVDVKLVAPGVRSWACDTNKYGIVTVQALVECVGPTGVEMEALTAVSGAALTVYDMCKAADRHMVMTNSRVVYKSGGKSGLHFYSKWVYEAAGEKGEWFMARGLEVPPPGRSSDRTRRS